MKGIISVSAIVLALAITLPRLSPAQVPSSCPVTKVLEPAFVPPVPYHEDTDTGDSGFFFGTPELWTVIQPEWKGMHGNKIPYFSEGFDGSNEPDPRLNVVARKLDGQDGLRWSDWANGSYAGENPEDHFMVTGVGELEPGCWEISAHYNPSREKIVTLTFTVFVKN